MHTHPILRKLASSTRTLLPIVGGAAILIASGACSSTSSIVHTTLTTGAVGSGRLYEANVFPLPATSPNISVFLGPYTSSSRTIGNITLPGSVLWGVALDPTDKSGTVYASDQTLGKIRAFARPNPNGGAPTVTVSGFTSPGSINFDSKGNLFVPDGNRVYEINHPITSSSVPNAIIASGLSSAICAAFDATDTLYVADPGVPALLAYAPPYTGAPVSTSNGLPGNPAICAYDKASNQLFIGPGNAGGSVVAYNLPLTSNESPNVVLTTASCCPGGIAFDASGNMFVAFGVDVSPAIAILRPPFGSTTGFTIPGGGYAWQLAISP